MQLFVGEKMDYEGAFCFAYQKEQEDEGPTFLFFKDGLKEMKYWVAAAATICKMHHGITVLCHFHTERPL